MSNSSKFSLPNYSEIISKVKFPQIKQFSNSLEHDIMLISSTFKSQYNFHIDALELCSFIKLAVIFYADFYCHWKWKRKVQMIESDRLKGISSNAVFGHRESYFLCGLFALNFLLYGWNEEMENRAHPFA